MVEPYEFLAPGKILFGWGERQRLGEEVARLGDTAWIVCGSRSLDAAGTVSKIIDLVSKKVAAKPLTTISREPTVADVDETTEKFRQLGGKAGDVIVGLGGGAAIDLAKAVSGLASSETPHSVVDYLEGVGQGLQVPAQTLPLIAVPTTAGTGSEATKNAVISGDGFKKSLRAPQLVPNLAVVDPELTISCPTSVTAHSGMDAITQLIESYISARRKPIPQAICVEGLREALPAIRIAHDDPENREARTAMAHAALLSGMALANSGLGMAHGVAASLGIHAGIPHGLACAFMLPATLRWNRATCEDVLAQLFTAAWDTADETDIVETAIREIEALNRYFNIPQKISELGVSDGQLPAIVQGSAGNSMNGNPRPISDEELMSVLQNM